MTSKGTIVWVCRRYMGNNACSLVTKNVPLKRVEVVKWLFKKKVVNIEPSSDYTANWRPVLSSERAPHRNKTANFRK
jgi:hypothetical protein